MEKCVRPSCPNAARGALCDSDLTALAMMCYGKVRRNEHNAYAAAKSRGKEGRGFPCRVCSAWHVGRMQPTTAERVVRVEAIIRELRHAGQIRLLASLAEDWSPIAGADRCEGWLRRLLG